MPNDQKIFVITGTSRGIGEGVSRYFLSQGHIVEGCSRSDAPISDPNYAHTQVDVSDEGQVSAWIRSIKKKHSGIDVVINNAGLAPAATSAMMTTGDTIRNVIHTNIMGTMIVAREAAKVMISKKSGRIINVSSMAVGLHEEGTSVYSASKSAVVEFTRIMAKELATLGITCNVIAPSMIKTEAVEALGDEVIERALSKLTIKRVVTIEEICNVLEFFIHPESGVITGQTVYMGLISG